MFGGILACTLLLSYLFLLPELTEVEVAGSVRNLQDLQAYEADLTEKIHTIQSKRDQLVLPVQDQSYHDLIAQKLASHDILEVKHALQQVAAQFTGEEDKIAVLLGAVEFDGIEGRFLISGDVRHVGPRSMTVLAQFTEKVRSLPFVKQMPLPRFTREQDPVIGMHSPFTLQITLQ